MSKIEALLKNEKVEWKRLGEKDVCVSITTGLNPRKNFKLNDSSSEEPTSWYITTKDYSSNEVIEFIEGKTARITEKARKLINKRSKLQINDILFSAVGTVGKIAFVEVEPNNFDVNESTFVLKPNAKNIVPKYLVYYLRSDFIQNEVKKSLKGSTLAGIRKNKLENLEIPIPSIKTQEKIVKILDTFTELTTELTLRQKQYEYYRDMLLSEEYLNKISIKIDRNNTEMSFYTLSKLFNTRNGYTPSKSVQEFWESEDIPWFKMEDIRENGNILSYAKNYVSNSAIKGEPFEQNSIILSTSATIGEHALITVPFLANQRFTCFSLKDNYKKEINIKYVYYYFYIIDKWCNNNIKIGNFPSVDVRTLLTQTIPIPSIYIQNKVVEILDAFQAMAHQVSGLLPKERELRQKQYEYYREKLLDFPK